MDPVHVVIVNYNTGEVAADCLRSLAAELSGWPSSRAVVVDNASPDGSGELLERLIERAGWAGWASVLRLPDNRGYGAGNNAWVRLALESKQAPACFILLNPDAYIRPGALRGLVDFASSRPGLGLAGPRLEHPDGTVQRSAFRFHSLLGELENGLALGWASRLLRRWVVAPEPPESACRVDWVAGACMLVKRQVFEEIGLFDEGFFLYYEEVDLCRRADRAGWERWYAPSSRVVHLRGRSTGVNDLDALPARRPGYWFESRRRYFLKNHGALYGLGTDLAWLWAHALWRLRAGLQRKKRADPPHLLGDFLRHSVLCRGFQA